MMFLRLMAIVELLRSAVGSHALKETGLSHLFVNGVGAFK